MAFHGHKKVIASLIERAIRDAILTLRGYRWRAYSDEIYPFIAWAIIKHNWGIVDCFSCGRPMWWRTKLKRWKPYCASCRSLASKAGIEMPTPKLY